MKTPSDHRKVRRSFALRLDAASWQLKKERVINELEDETGRSVLLDEMVGGRLVAESLHAGCRCKYTGDLILTWNNRLIPWCGPTYRISISLVTQGLEICSVVIDASWNKAKINAGLLCQIWSIVIGMVVRASERSGSWIAFANTVGPRNLRWRLRLWLLHRLAWPLESVLYFSAWASASVS